jgi:hypothetical protein
VPTRRTVLLGGAGLAVVGLVGAGVGVEKDVLPGRTFAYQHLGLNGEDGVIPDLEPGAVLEDSFTSAARGGVEVGWSLLLPPGTDEATPLPSPWPCTGSAPTTGLSPATGWGSTGTSRGT